MQSACIPATKNHRHFRTSPSLRFTSKHSPIATTRHKRLTSRTSGNLRFVSAASACNSDTKNARSYKRRGSPHVICQRHSWWTGSLGDLPSRAVRMENITIDNAKPRRSCCLECGKECSSDLGVFTCTADGAFLCAMSAFTTLSCAVLVLDNVDPSITNPNKSDVYTGK